uniref:Myb/SANT-like domain-containing protein n=1 Tax=Solanum lycopersicum TaxID=4081 RepID=A0A3Q7GV91_SOLLC
MENHWDGMKAEWTLFKQLMKRDTCIGWDSTKNTIMTDDVWWKRKIKVDYDEERQNGIDNDDMKHFINTNNEGGDESDDPEDMNSSMFPKPSIKRPIQLMMHADEVRKSWMEYNHQLYLKKV